MNKRTVFVIAILVFAAGIVLGLFLLTGSSNKAMYRTEAVTRGDVEASVVTTGTLDPVTLVEVGSQVSGKIANIYVDFNSHVQKGQALAELDKASFEDEVKQNEANYSLASATLEKAKVTLDEAKKKYDRTLDLFQKNLVSAEDKEADEEQYLADKDDLEDAQAGVQEAKAVLDSSRIDLSNTVIRSPIDGVVVSREVSVGQTVAAAMQAPVLFKIASDLSKLRVDCDVDESDVGDVREGEKVRFDVESFPEETFTGRVIQVRYGATEEEGVVTYTAVVEVDNSEAKLLPGMTATVSIITGEAKDVLKVPNAALRFKPAVSSGPSGKSADNALLKQTAGKKIPFVWVLGAKGKLTQVLIQTGITGNIYTEVVSGDLKEGDRIVTVMQSKGS
jgi:HlyD family secretion protein